MSVKIFWFGIKEITDSQHVNNKLSENKNINIM